MIDRTASRRIGALAGRVLVVLCLVAIVVGGVVGLERSARRSAAPAAGPLPEQVVEPAPVRPGSTAPPVEREFREPGEGNGVDSVRAWADQVASDVDVPARALVSYVNADMAMRHHQPDCRISWATLAGIGRVESDHGRFGGGALGENALPSEPIIGVPLDGASGVQAISDTDGGRLDGDSTYDRAVGPMQFIPSTWRSWATDGHGDGVGDPQNLDDAAMAAARYLCSNGGDLATGDGWWGSVLSYNNSVEYGQKVFALAETYSDAARRRS